MLATLLSPSVLATGPTLRQTLPQVLAEQGQAAQALRAGQVWQLEGVALEAVDGPQSLRLQAPARLQAPRLTVVEAGRERLQAWTPRRLAFTGTLLEDASSRAFVLLDPGGQADLIIERRGAQHLLQARPASGTRTARLQSRRVDPAVDFATRPLRCGQQEAWLQAETAQAWARTGPAVEARRQAADAPGARAGTAGPRRADLIVETDHALFLRLGGARAVADFVHDLVAFSNQALEAEVGARLNLLEVRVQASPDEPWTGASVSALVQQLQARWNAPGLRGQARHHVHLLSGRLAGGGISFFNSLGTPDRGYGVSAGIHGVLDPANPLFLADAATFGHELGHVFASDHAQNFDRPLAGRGEAGPIDCCAADHADSVCALRNGGTYLPGGVVGALPGPGRLDGGAPGRGAGTLMSYCHLTADRAGPGNRSFSYGTQHAEGVQAERIAEVMRAAAQAFLPMDSVAPAEALLSVQRSGAGQGQVGSVPPGLNCGSDCFGRFPLATPLSLIAAPASGHRFAGWDGACVHAGTASTCTLTLDGPRQAQARFEPLATGSTLSVQKAGTGRGLVHSEAEGLRCAADCQLGAASFPTGSTVRLQALPEPGSDFGGWLGGGCDGQAASCSLSLQASTQVSARFSALGAGSSSARALDVVHGAYLAYYGRPADPGGLAYWAARVDAQGGGLDGLIDAFGDSAEYRQRLAGLPAGERVALLYRRLFKREPEPAGLAFHVESLQSGRRSLGMIALDVLHGAQGEDLLSRENKRAAAQSFTARVAEGCALDLLAEGVPMLAGVDARASSLEQLRRQLASRCGP